MAYSRFGTSDVYFLHHVDEYFDCCCCRLMPKGRYGMHEDFTTKSRSHAVQHLHEHRLVGHKVGYGATKKLRREIKELGDRVQ